MQVRQVTSRLSARIRIIVNIKIKYVTLNHLYYLRIKQIIDFFSPGGLPVFINGYGVPFLSYYMLVLLIDPRKQLLFAAGKTPLGPL